jgi:hypothetical protein
MIRLYLTLCLSLICVFMAGCSFSRNDQSVDNSDQRFFFDDHREAQRQFDLLGAHCADANDCPESALAVYSLGTTQNSYVSYCSGVLIGANRVLTNAHCIPRDISRAGASCQGRIRLAFAGTSQHSSESLDCETVINMSQEPLLTNQASVPDWAILQTRQSTRRTPVVVEQAQGISENEDLTIMKVDFKTHLPFYMRGQIAPTRCRGNTNHYFSNSHVGEISPLFNFSHCDQLVQGGNSGAGVVNGQGHLVGVLSFVNPIETSVTEFMEYLRREMPGMRQRTGGGTQLACIPLQPDQELDPFCHFNRADYNLQSSRFQHVKAQRSHPSFILIEEQILEALNSEDPVEVQFGPWTEEIFAAISGMEVEIQSVHGRRVLEERLQNQFPLIPTCVDPGAPSSFSLNWYTRETETSLDVDQSDWRVMSESRVSNKTLRFRRHSQGQVYILTLFQGLEVELGLCNSSQ